MYDELLEIIYKNDTRDSYQNCAMLSRGHSGPARRSIACEGGYIATSVKTSMGDSHC
ncbi:MAG: hypothetical protein QOJ42_7795 [Acidobacteriaceae bacterium]|jgi:transketolase N-terminal domain/subunit|nr:hypothetical protein [Acidobacteriaceae bacterium]